MERSDVKIIDRTPSAEKHIGEPHDFPREEGMQYLVHYADLLKQRSAERAAYLEKIESSVSKTVFLALSGAFSEPDLTRKEMPFIIEHRRNAPLTGNPIPRGWAPRR